MTMRIDDNTVVGLPHVEATLNYLVDTGEKPVTYLYEPPPGTPRRTGETNKHTMPIYDGRAILEHMSLDIQGFQLTGHDTKVVNFYDAEEVQAVYYPEVE